MKLKFPSEERADKILKQKHENASNHPKQKKGDEATLDLEIEGFQKVWEWMGNLFYSS